jgi:putative NIF3 family GTP cyclohydrolase 1 type 2
MAPFALTREAAAEALTAQDLIDRIQKNLGVAWKAETADGLKAGDASTVVTGVVSTSMATLDVLQRAVKAGANFIVTGHPTFYSRSDARTPPAGRGGRGGGRGTAGTDQPPGPPAPPPNDAVFTGKNAYIDKHGLVVFRLSDHWRLRQPDPYAQGLATAMGWTKQQAAGDLRAFEVPQTTLAALAAAAKKNLQSRGGMRVIGDPKIQVRRIGLLPGSTPIQATVALLPNVDVVLAGEVREWESVEYARDMAFSGSRKGMILVGRIVSEEPAMDVCARWLTSLVPEVPVRHLSAGDPYWRPSR